MTLGKLVLTITIVCLEVAADYLTDALDVE
jgi:hypothetical protein